MKLRNSFFLKHYSRISKISLQILLTSTECEILKINNGKKDTILKSSHASLVGTQEELGKPRFPKSSCRVQLLLLRQQAENKSIIQES